MTRADPADSATAGKCEKLFALSDSLWYRNSSELRGISAGSTNFERQLNQQQSRTELLSHLANRLLGGHAEPEFSRR